MSFYLNGIENNSPSGSQPDKVQVKLGDEIEKNEGKKLKRTVSFRTTTSYAQSSMTSLENSKETQHLQVNVVSQYPSSENKSGKKKSVVQFFSRGISLFSRKKKEEAPSSKPIKKEGKNWEPTKSDGILLIKRQTAMGLSSMPGVNMSSLEKDLKRYFASLPSKMSHCILRADDEVVRDIKSYMMQKGIDKWLFTEVYKNEKVMQVVQEFTREFKEASLMHCKEEKQKFAYACGEKLFSAIATVLISSLERSEQPMPSSLKDLLQIINHETKKRFPDAPSEVITNRLFFLRYIVPLFTEEMGEDVMVRAELSKFLNDYVQTLSSVPEELQPLFRLTFDQLEKVIQLHFSKRGDLSHVGSLFREDGEEELFIKRWVEYSSEEWMDEAIVKNKSVQLAIDELVVDFEEQYQKIESSIPQEVKTQWGKHLFSTVVTAIVKSNRPLPTELRQLATLVNTGIKKHFSEVSSEKLVCQMLFLRFFIPALLKTKANQLAQLSSQERVVVVKCMMKYVNNDLQELPEDLKQCLFKA